MDVILGQRAIVIEFIVREVQALLCWRIPGFELDLSFHVVGGVGRVDLQRDGLVVGDHDKDLERLCVTIAAANGQLQNGPVLNTVMEERAVIMEMVARIRQRLLLRRNALVGLDLSFQVFDGVRCLGFQSDWRASGGFQ